MATSIFAFMARIDEGIAGCRVAMDARVICGKEDDRQVGPGWQRERGREAGWAAAGRARKGEGEESWAAGWVSA